MLLIANLQNQCFYFCCTPFHECDFTDSLFSDLHINIPLLVFIYFHFVLTNGNITEFTKIPVTSNCNLNPKFTKHIYSSFILYFEVSEAIFIKILLQNLHVQLNSFALMHFLKCYLCFIQKCLSQLFQFSRRDYLYFLV